MCVIMRGSAAVLYQPPDQQAIGLVDLLLNPCLCRHEPGAHELHAQLAFTGPRRALDDRRHHLR